MAKDTEFDPKLHSLLVKTSRTFALSIPVLPNPLRQQITLAYLIFRVADTLEDGELLTKAEKLESLAQLADTLGAIEHGQAWDSQLPLNGPPTENVDYLDLLEQWPYVLQRAEQLEESARREILLSAQKSILGMRQFILSGSVSGAARIASLDELRSYCYYVAGVVGEMLTELFLMQQPSLSNVIDDLREHARWFGEGLQLVNIVKDSNDDRESGRSFIPPSVERDVLYELAREDLVRAEIYIDRLRMANASPQVSVFNELPVKLAWRTLERVEEDGPGAKVPRAEVALIISKSLAAAGLDAMKETLKRTFSSPRANC